MLTIEFKIHLDPSEQLKVLRIIKHLELVILVIFVLFLSLALGADAHFGASSADIQILHPLGPS